MKNYNIQRIFFEIYYLDLFIFIIVNAIIAAQLGYTLCDWSVFFVKKAATKVFAGKISFENISEIFN